MRKQKLSKPLKMGVKNRKEILAFINQRMEQEYGKERINAEGTLLQMQGLLPPKIDYGRLIADLLSEQVAGFYDHTRQELHIADWIPSFIQGPVMAHEIFHAIQDQEWGGGKLIDSKKYRHDEVLAHAALLEGDATVVMFNYSQPANGGVDISLSTMMAKMIAASIPMQMQGSQFPKLAGAPDYLKQSLVFPYLQGFLFVCALRQSGLSWDKIRDVYRSPPQSTEQILHPKKYLPPRDVPSLVRLKGPILPGFRHRWTEVLGEFHFRQLLLQKLPVTDAEIGASGWDGDLTILASKGDTDVIVTISTWDTPQDAEKFERALKTVDAQQKPAPSHLKTTRSGTTLILAWSTDPNIAQKALSVGKRPEMTIERR